MVKGRTTVETRTIKRIVEFEEWRYYGKWHTPGWVHKCGPRGGATGGVIWARKKTPLKPCPKCGAEVPSELQMVIKLQATLDGTNSKR